MHYQKLKVITNALEDFAPLNLQESYDNSGLLIGSAEDNISNILITLDITDEVMDEAIEKSVDLIIAHHPIIFKGIKRLTDSNLTERIVVKAIKNNIAIYAIHTNLDNVKRGVNEVLSRKLNLVNTKVLSPKNEGLIKLVTFCPLDKLSEIQEAMFEAGAGYIGDYDKCSYYTDGNGTFRALEGTNPYVGNKGEVHTEKEFRLETIVPEYMLNRVLRAMINSHPYEEPAYDIYKLSNQQLNVGSGMIGELETPQDVTKYLEFVKEVIGAKYLKHNQLIDKPVSKVAICGGSGSFLIGAAVKQKADIFITSDIKYHDYFEHSGLMTLVDAGHYETEQPVKELIYDILKKKFPNFAVQISERSKNPVSFF